MKTASAGALERAPAAGQAPVTLLWCLVGLLIPRAMLYGALAPFGVSLAAAGEGMLPVLGALTVGYLLADGVMYPLRYIAAVAAVAGMRWVLAALPAGKLRPLAPPVMAFAATLSTGLMMMGRSGADVYRVLLVIAESVVAGGCSLFFRTAVDYTLHLQERPVLSPGQQASVVLTGAVAVMAACTVSVSGFLPGRVIATLLVLVMARSGRETGGCMAGAIAGTAIALAMPGQLSAAVTLAFGGLIAGLFSRFGRPVETLAFWMAAGVITLTETEEAVLFRLYEVLIAGVLFMLLPRAWDRKLNHLFIRSRELPEVEGLRRAAGMRLRVAARAMEEVSGTVAAVSARLADRATPDVSTVLRSSTHAACGACPHKAHCWGENGQALFASLDGLIPTLLKEGRLSPDRLTGWAAEKCRWPEQLTDYINRSYEQYIARRTAWQRLGELQATVGEQFRATGSLLSTIAGDLEDPRQVDTELSGRVAALCTDFGMPVREALCARGDGNRLTVEIIAKDVGVRLDKGRWLQEMQRICGRELAPPATAACGKDVRITLTEKPRYTTEVGLARMCCGSEKLCGDAADSFTHEGRRVILLSDGMGSGGRAAVDSAMTVGLSSRLWQAGFSPDSIIKTVNAALMVKSREESLSTLDVAVIDEFTGRMDSYKAGAATTLLYSGGRVSRLERPSLPIGILPDITFEHNQDRLAAEDILLLISDGVLCGGCAPVEVMLRDRPEGESMQALADRIAKAAREAQGDHQDDITVIAMQLHKAKA